MILLEAPPYMPRYRDSILASEVRTYPCRRVGGPSSCYAVVSNPPKYSLNVPAGSLVPFSLEAPPLKDPTTQEKLLFWYRNPRSAAYRPTDKLFTMSPDLKRTLL